MIALIVTIAVIVIIGIIFLIYRLCFKKDSPSKDPNAQFNINPSGQQVWLQTTY